jgi:hypothetical protein
MDAIKRGKRALMVLHSIINSLSGGLMEQWTPGDYGIKNTDLFSIHQVHVWVVESVSVDGNTITARWLWMLEELGGAGRNAQPFPVEARTAHKLSDAELVSLVGIIRQAW